jgi:hypothetical protein
LDSHVIFNAEGAGASLQSWTVNVTDESGNVQRFGPYTADQASIPAKTILGDKAEGTIRFRWWVKQRADKQSKKKVLLVW